MEEQVEYAPEVPAESAEAIPEETGEQVVEAAPEVEEVAEPTPAEEDDAKAKGLLKAAQEERRKRQEIKEDRDFWYKVATGEIANPAKPEATVKPRPEQFTDYDEYVEALADYKAEQAILRRMENTQKLTREQLAQREDQRLMAKASKDAEEAAKRYQDFGDVVRNVNLPPETLKAMYASEVGADIAYYLGKNNAELDRISELPIHKQVMELGKLEVKLTTKQANPETKKVKQATAVEKPGSGFEKPKTNLSQLRDAAIKSGTRDAWAKYMMEAGMVPE